VSEAPAIDSLLLSLAKKGVVIYDQITEVVGNLIF